MPFARRIARQLRQLTGLLGRAFGAFLIRANRRINHRVVERLDVHPGHRVLDIGFGGGIGLGRVMEQNVGFAAGIEISEPMLRQGRRRFRREIEAGTVELACADVAAIPFDDRSFDRVSASTRSTSGLIRRLGFERSCGCSGRAGGSCSGRNRSPRWSSARSPATVSRSSPKHSSRSSSVTPGSFRFQSSVWTTPYSPGDTSRSPAGEVAEPLGDRLTGAWGSPIGADVQRSVRSRSRRQLKPRRPSASTRSAIIDCSASRPAARARLGRLLAKRKRTCEASRARSNAGRSTARWRAAK